MKGLVIFKAGTTDMTLMP